MNWVTILPLVGAIIPPAWLAWSVHTSNVVGLNIGYFTIGTVFFLACLGWLAATNLYEKGEL